MAVDPIVEEYGLPVNAQGEIVASWGTGDTAISGVLPPGFVPVRADNGKVPIKFVDVPASDTTGAYVDTQVRLASVAIPTTPTVFVWETEVSDTQAMYNPSTGEMVMPFTGQWSFVFTFNATSSVSTKVFYAAAQTWNGSVWVTSEFSTRQDSVRNGESRQVLFTSQNQFTEGTKLRFVVWGQSNLTINTQTITTGYTVPAARLLITGVKTI